MKNFIFKAPNPGIFLHESTVKKAVTAEKKEKK